MQGTVQEPELAGIRASFLYDHKPVRVTLSESRNKDSAVVQVH